MTLEKPQCKPAAKKYLQSPTPRSQPVSVPGSASPTPQAQTPRRLRQKQLYRTARASARQVAQKDRLARSHARTVHDRSGVRDVTSKDLHSTRVSLLIFFAGHHQAIATVYSILVACRRKEKTKSAEQEANMATTTYDALDLFRAQSQETLLLQPRPLEPMPQQTCAGPDHKGR